MDHFALSKLKWETEECVKLCNRRNSSLINQASPNLQRKIRRALDGFEPILCGLNDFEKVSLLYQCLTKETTYDYSGKKSLSGCFLGPLRDCVGVCEGISELFLMLINKLTSCDVYKVIGYTKDDLRPTQGHAWNIIRFSEGELKGLAFHCDPTFDIGHNRLSWFLKADGQMKERIWIREYYPAANTPFTGIPYRNEKKLNELCNYYRDIHKIFEI